MTPSAHQPSSQPSPADVLGAHLVQPNQRTCGPSVLVVARMLRDQDYAAAVLSTDSFAEQVQSLHRRLGSVLPTGRPQLPWPRALGTSPWASARFLSRMAGRPHRARMVIGRRESAYVAVVRAVRAGRPVPVYVGSRRLPRHVVLAVEVAGGQLRAYDPARGVVVPLPREEWVDGALNVSGWSTPWFAVLPRRR